MIWWQSQTLAHRFLIILGSMYISLSLIANKWTLTNIFSADRQISDLNLTIIWVFNLSLITIGLMTIILRQKSSIININILILSSIFAWGAAEFYLNFKFIETKVFMMTEENISADPRDLRRVDRYVHHAFKKNAIVLDRWKNKKILYYTNSLGFRDKERREVPQKTQKEHRILIMGDSITEGVGLVYENTFSHQLEGLFRDGNHEVEILNAGMGGYCPLLELRQLELFLEAGNTTDEVVVMFDVTDVQDEGAIYTGADWKVSSEEWIQAALDMWGENDQNAIRPRLIPFIQYHLRKLTTTDEVQTKMAELWEFRGNWTEKDTAHFSWITPGIKSTQENLLKIFDLCRTNDIKFSFVIYPLPVQIMSDKRPSIHQSIYKKFAQEHNLVLHDLFSTFFNLEDWETSFLLDDFHWSREGNRIVAKKLYDILSPSLKNKVGTTIEIGTGIQ